MKPTSRNTILGTNV